MATFSHALVARSIKHVEQSYNGVYRDEGPSGVDVPVWFFPAVALTTVFFILAIGAINYTYGVLLPTLAMVEEPAATYIIRTSPSDQDEPDAPLIAADEKTPVEQELLLIKAKPITATLRLAIRHLRQKAGRWARFRGVHVLAILVLLQALFASLFSALLPSSLLTSSVVGVASSVVFCRLAMAWTHIVISEPRPDKRWYQRLADRSAARRIIVPTLKFAIAELVANFIPLFALQSSGLIDMASRIHAPDGRRELVSSPYPVLALLWVFAASIFSHFFIYLPATVMLVRTQASLLPEGEQPIVPFDRTYGGKVVPLDMGGSGRLEMFDAWRSFDWNARVRLVKIYIKALMLEIATIVMYYGILAAQVYFAFGPQLKDFLERVRNTEG